MVPMILFLLTSVLLGCDLKLIYKCCREGEELHSNGRDCVKRHDQNIQILEEDEIEIVDKIVEIKNHSLYWLPSSFSNQLEEELIIAYEDQGLCEYQSFLLINVSDTHRYTITNNLSLIVYFTYFNGKNIAAMYVNDMYCLDSISGSRGPHVFRLCTNKMFGIRKCCNFGQRIRMRHSRASCENHEKTTWSVHNFIFRSYLPTNTVIDVLDNSISLCGNGEFKVLPQNDIIQYIEENLDEVSFDEERTFMRNYDCFDSISDGFSDNETIGFCYHTSGTKLAYNFVFRHFSAPVALMLAIGLVILGSRPDIYKTVHGKALICYMFSLCVDHVLQAVWEYWLHGNENCTKPAVFVLNFFMMSSVLWLSAICFNMVKGFGAGTLESRKKRNRWAVFAWYSLYVWGCSLLHTVLLATQPWQKYSYPDIVRYLYHTRTCLVREDWRDFPNLDIMLPYYGPASILLITNVCFLTSTILKIRKMQRNTSMLHRRLSINISNNQSHKTSLKYVRLLLTTGVAETAAEIAALVTRLYGAYNTDGSRLMDNDIWEFEVRHKEALFRILAASCDLARAVSMLVLCFSNDRPFRCVCARKKRDTVGNCLKITSLCRGEREI